jgi:hypothetical protein
MIVMHDRKTYKVQASGSLGQGGLNKDAKGARYLMGENLKVVWAEFSALSLAILLYCTTSARQTYNRF